MFIRKKIIENTTHFRIQICENRREGKKVVQKVVRNVGVAKSETDVERYMRIANGMLTEEIAKSQGCVPLFSDSREMEEGVSIKDMHKLREVKRIQEGPNEVLGTLFDELGFSQILSGEQSQLLRETVIARVIEPDSKLGTVEKLEKKCGFNVSVDRVYRMMDTLSKRSGAVSNAVFNATTSLFNQKLDVVFFDVTTLYFESVVQDELKEFGFSKDQKFHQVQVVLALATTAEGLPVGYKLFPGNVAETKTLVQCLNEWKQYIEIGHVVFVADRGMFSAENLHCLSHAGYEFIVAAPLRRMSATIKNQALDEVGYRVIQVADGEPICWVKTLAHEINVKTKDESGKWKEVGTVSGKLIVSYSTSRAKKDKMDRERILEKLNKILDKKKADAGKLISNKGYLKYAHLEGEKLASIDEIKVTKDAEWDGIHSIFTNSSKPIQEILARYKGLWVIEETFRIGKNDLEMRPIYHFSPRRIRAHIAICFLALSLVRHAQYRLRKHGINLSPQRFREELMTIEASILKEQGTGKQYRVPSAMTEQAQKIYQTFAIKRRLAVHAI